MRVLCIVPSRLGSTRLPAKPLRLLAGEPLVRHVARRVVEFDLGPVWVATDDSGIADAVDGTGARAVLTPACVSGTARVAAALQAMSWDADVVVNVQGDEPLIPRDVVTGAIERVRAGDDVGTAAGVLESQALWDAHRVKVEVDGRGAARRFYRVPAPPECVHRHAVFQHIGVYAYRPDTLERWLRLPPVPAEQTEQLEQLRPLAHGMRVGVAMWSEAPPPGVDTEGDLDVVERQLEVLTGG